MKFVGEKLEDLALKDPEFCHSDLLGRSAFNRYYYASFLITRKLLGELRSNWKGTAHKNIPELLRESLKKPVVTTLNSQVKKGLMSQSEKSRILTRLQISTEELAEMLEAAYDARIIADYIPEELIDINNKVICLRSYKLSTAKQWPDRASSYCKTIYRVWGDAGLA